MIKYTVCGNTIIAEFDKPSYCTSQKSFWTKTILISLDKLFEKYDIPYSSFRFVEQVVDRVSKIQNFYGKAVCSPEDDFNYKIGSHLAKVRLLEKYNKVYYSVLHSVIGGMNDQTDKVIETLGKKIVSDRRLQSKLH